MTKIIWLAILSLIPAFGLAQRTDTLPESRRIQALLPLQDSLSIVQKLHDSLQKLALIQSAHVDSIISFSKKFIGTPYRYGGRTPKGFDCSGFVGYVFKHFGIELPPSSRSQALIGEKIPRDSIQRGDLVFFKGRSSKSNNIGHVALVVAVSDTNDIQFIHSTRHGLRLDWLSQEPYYKKRFMASRRLRLGTAKSN